MVQRAQREQAREDRLRTVALTRLWARSNRIFNDIRFLDVNTAIESLNKFYGSFLGALPADVTPPPRAVVR